MAVFPNAEKMITEQAIVAQLVQVPGIEAGTWSLLNPLLAVWL